MSARRHRGMTDDDIIADARSAEASLALIARTRRPTAAESQRALAAYAAAAAVERRRRGGA